MFCEIHFAKHIRETPIVSEKLLKLRMIIELPIDI